MSNSNRIETRQRLDRVLADAAHDADPVTRAQVEAFEALLRGRRALGRGPTLRDELDRLVMPVVGDATIFRGARPRELLAFVLQHVVPALGAEDDVAAIASALLEEEIARHDDIAERRVEATDP